LSKMSGSLDMYAGELLINTVWELLEKSIEFWFQFTTNVLLALFHSYRAPMASRSVTAWTYRMSPKVLYFSGGVLFSNRYTSTEKVNVQRQRRRISAINFVFFMVTSISIGIDFFDESDSTFLRKLYHRLLR